MTSQVRTQEFSNTYMTDSKRYQHLCDYRAGGSRNDVYELNRVNYDFLLKAYDEKERLKAENKFLKNELKHYKGANL